MLELPEVTSNIFNSRGKSEVGEKNTKHHLWAETSLTPASSKLISQKSKRSLVVSCGVAPRKAAKPGSASTDKMPFTFCH